MITAYNREVSSDPSGLPPDLPPDILGRIPLFAELQKVLSWAGGPVNWDLARQVAVAAAAASGPQVVDPSVAAELSQDARTAHLWISEATGIGDPGAVPPARAVSAADWAEHACIAYREMIDPLAAKVAAAIGDQAGSALGEALGDDASALPPGMDAGAIGAALKQMAPLFLGVQTGGVLGAVAKDVLGSRDLSIPPADGAPVIVVPAAIAALAEEYHLDPREALMYVVLHECAHRNIEETLPTFRSSFFALFHDYVTSLSIDFSGAFERLQGLDFGNPAGVEEQLGSQGFFDLLDSPASSAAAGRLEHLIALTEAFADRMVDAGAEGRLPSAARLAEAAARHRSGAEGTAALRQFMGVGASDEAHRAAARFMRAVLSDAGDHNGWNALNRMWEDSETMPTQSEIADHTSWLGRIR